MMAATLFDAMEATWPAASALRKGPWTIRAGKGGGKRVSAATADGPWSDEDFFLAEAEMAALGQTSLFMVRENDDLLDHALQARGYRIVDPVIGYCAPVTALLDPELSAMSAFAHWPPLAVCQDIWLSGGIGPSRWAVMSRAEGPKCAILARINDRPSGTAFVAKHGQTAMLHALEVPQVARRQGAATVIMKKAASWALENNCNQISIVVTVANEPARALYTALGMAVCGQYHYREKV